MKFGKLIDDAANIRRDRRHHLGAPLTRPCCKRFEPSCFVQRPCLQFADLERPKVDCPHDDRKKLDTSFPSPANNSLLHINQIDVSRKDESGKKQENYYLLIIDFFFDPRIQGSTNGNIILLNSNHMS